MQIDMGKLITSIDFGSSKTVVAIARKEEEGIRVIHWGSAPSGGIKFGEISNTTKCAKVLGQLLDEAREATGEKIEDAVVSISGKKIENSDEKIETERISPTSSINPEEIRNITEKRYGSDDENKRILEVAPQQYNIDDDYNVDFNDLEGMRGKKLESYFKVFGGKSSLVETRAQVLSECGIKMKQCILSPVAASRAILTDNEREKGVVLIDMGKDLTEICIVRGNVVRDLFVLPFAGESVTRDISNVSGISSTWAEAIKVKHGYCLEEVCPENKTLELINEDGEEDAEVELQLLTRVIESRVSEIFDAVKYLVNRNKFAEKLQAGYVLTGGSAYLGYILPLAKTILGAKVRLAAPRNCIASDSESGAFDAGSSVAVGLILENDSAMLSTTRHDRVERQSTAPYPGSPKPEDPRKDNASGGLFGGLFGHKEQKTQKKEVPAPEQKTAPRQDPKPQKQKPKKDSSIWLGSIFSDDGNGNNA